MSYFETMETVWLYIVRLAKNLQTDSYPRTDPITVPANQPRSPKFDLNNPHSKAEKEICSQYTAIHHTVWSVLKLKGTSDT